MSNSKRLRYDAIDWKTDQSEWRKAWMSHLLFEKAGLTVAKKLPTKIDKQIEKAGLPKDGIVPFDPELEKNKKGKQIIKKGTVTHGPKKGKKGYVDTNGRIWIKDRAHAGDPDHWDVQEDGGKKYIRVDPQGNLLR